VRRNLLTREGRKAFRILLLPLSVECMDNNLAVLNIKLNSMKINEIVAHTHFATT